NRQVVWCRWWRPSHRSHHRHHTTCRLQDRRSRSPGFPLSMNKALSRLERGQFTHKTRSSFCNVMAHRGKSTLLVEPKLDHNMRHGACCELGGLTAVIRIPEICS